MRRTRDRQFPLVSETIFVERLKPRPPPVCARYSRAVDQRDAGVDSGSHASALLQSEHA